MHRSKEAILCDILSSSLEKVNKTKLMYKVSIRYPKLMGYLGYLIDRGLLLQIDGLYLSSEKGRVYINAYQKMSEIIA